MQQAPSFSPNVAQQQAIDKTEGPVMLLAGPGTGKTFTLTKRIEKILSKGVAPENILCLTFSDPASAEMTKRLIDKIGLSATGINVSTYHSFCYKIIKQNASEFDMQDNVQKADENIKQAILKEAIDEYLIDNEIEFLKDKWGNKYFYITHILDGIELIKRERVTKDDFFSFIEENSEWKPRLDELNIELEERKLKNKVVPTFLDKIDKIEKKIGKAKEFYSIYKIYEKKLAQNGLIDFSDMINLVLTKMEEDEDFLAEVCKNYKYVLVDEYQDTSKVQNELIFNILKGAKTDNIFVVGDDDQIIFSFQGARCKNLVDFLEKFPKTEIIKLTENRRSTQTILDFSEKLIAPDNFRITKSKQLIAKNPDIISKDRKIKFDIYSETMQENNTIVEKIEELIKKGEKLSEIAVLARTNEYLINFGRLLKQKNIPFVLSRQKNALDLPAFIVCYFYLKILCNSYIQQEKLYGLLNNPPFKIKEKNLAKLFSIQRKENKNLIEALSDEAFKDEEEITEFLKVLNELKSKKGYVPLIPYIHEILGKTGILKFYANSGAEQFDNISAIQRLIDEANSFCILHKGALLEDFVHHLDCYFNENIPIKLKKDATAQNAIQLLTYHGSKGREFEYVFMPALISSDFENKRDSSNNKLILPVQKSVFSEDKDENKDAEILRLLYVGATRCKFDLTLSYSTQDDGKAQQCTKYISNMFPEAEIYINRTIYDINKDALLNEITKNLQINFITDEYKLELQKRIEDIVISQTALNSYLDCPLNYFYKEILKVPVYQDDKDILEYGSSIHDAIYLMSKDAVKNDIWGNMEDMYKHFCSKMDEKEFSTPEKRAELLERGKNSIEKNYPKLTETPPKNIYHSEYKMELEFEGTTLKGFADRICKNKDNEIQIYDFKTGSYKKVKPDEKYYNQLRFYKFLYEELNPDEKVSETSLIFFEEGCKTSSPDPDLSNNQEIKLKIKEVVNGIKSLEFMAKPDKNNCKNCAYKLVCKLNSTNFE